jgi:putative transcriptional regulator
MDKAFSSIKKGLNEALAYTSGQPKGRTRTPKIHRLDVKAIRRKAGMTQGQFASSFGIGLGTLRHWEQGDRSPRGPARILLKVIEKAPETVLRANAGGL